MENRGGRDLTLVYKLEINNGRGELFTQYKAKVIPAFSKIPVETKYRRIDVGLFQDFLTPLYMK